MVLAEEDGAVVERDTIEVWSVLGTTIVVLLLGEIQGLEEYSQA